MNEPEKNNVPLNRSVDVAINKFLVMTWPVVYFSTIRSLINQLKYKKEAVSVKNKSAS